MPHDLLVNNNKVALILSKTRIILQAYLQLVMKQFS